MQQPGKLNLKNFAIVNEAIARMNVNSDNNMPEGDEKKFGVSNKASIFDHAPLAAPEDDSDDVEYAQVKDVYGHEFGGAGGDQMYTFPHDSTPNKTKPRHRRDNKGQSNFFDTSLKMSCLASNEYNSVTEYSDSDSESSSSERKSSRGYDGYYKMNRKAQTHKRMRKKRSAIPVQPPKVPFGTYVSPPEIPLLYQKMKTEKKLGTVEKGIH